MASKNDDHEGEERKSIRIKLIRHAESENNQVYRQARHIYKGGTDHFDFEGWTEYVDKNRKADPGISDVGVVQSQRLADYLVQQLQNQASRPYRFIVSPMKRTLDSIIPTLSKLSNCKDASIDMVVNALYHESEGCHIKGVQEPGMNQEEIKNHVCTSTTLRDVSFVGFDKDPNAGWYHGKGAETRVESEIRARAFYIWLCEYLDMQLNSSEKEDDLFDAGVTLPFEIDEIESDMMSPRARKRRTAILVGHGDFMSLVLKNIISGFGNTIEHDGVPHRVAFAHHNTGITELEYFGSGRFLMMSTNQTHHLDNVNLKTGGGLKDGWSYLMPSDNIISHEEVGVSLADELDAHLKAQINILKSFNRDDFGQSGSFIKSSMEVEEMNSRISPDLKQSEATFVVKQGMKVIGCASFNIKTSILSHFIIKPSMKKNIENIQTLLLGAIVDHAKKSGQEKVLAHPENTQEKDIFLKLGFTEDGSNMYLNL